MITTATEARNLAERVVWYGHTSRKTAETIASPAGIELAVTMGLIREVPRLGGYVATKGLNAKTFGRKFAEWVAE